MECYDTQLPCGFCCCTITVLYDLVCEVNCGDWDNKLVCGRRILALVALNLALDWDGVLVSSVMDGADASPQFGGIGDV